MKFTIERTALIKLLELVAKKMPGQKRRDKTVRLSACAARVFVEGNQTTAGIEAIVLEDGGCTVAHDVFAKLLKSYAPKANLTFEADGKAIRFGSTSLPISSFSKVVTPPGRFQLMPVTDLSVVLPSKETVPPPAASSAEVATPSAPVSSFCACYPWEEYWTEALGTLVRRLCGLGKVSPPQLVGLARALYALERMPAVTPGVWVEVSVGWCSEEEPGGRWHRMAGCFLVSDQELRCDWYSGGGDGERENEDSVMTEYEESTRIDRFRLEPGEFAYCRLVRWFEQVWEFIEGGERPEFYVAVADDSSPEAVPRATMGPAKGQ